MDELELLKKDWETSSKNYPELDKKTLYKLINKRSSSLVKWIFIISLLEFVFWTLISLVTNDAESLEKLKSYNVDYIIYPLTVFGYLVLGYFFYVFYKNYKNIYVTENTKVLMERILKTRKTVKYYVIYNLTFMCLGIPLAVIMELSSNPETQILISDIKSEGENNIYIFYLIVAVLSLIAMALITILFLGFYYLIYGLLLKRLKINYKELKKIVDVE